MFYTILWTKNLEPHSSSRYRSSNAILKLHLTTCRCVVLYSKKNDPVLKLTSNWVTVSTRFVESFENNNFFQSYFTIDETTHDDFFFHESLKTMPTCTMLVKNAATPETMTSFSLLYYLSECTGTRNANKSLVLFSSLYWIPALLLQWINISIPSL